MQTREEPRRDVTFEPDPYAASLDLGPGGAVVTIGWDRLVHLTDRPAGEGLQADGQFSVGVCAYGSPQRPDAVRKAEKGGGVSQADPLLVHGDPHPRL
jgi:hypothetical protein